MFFVECMAVGTQPLLEFQWTPTSTLLNQGEPHSILRIESLAKHTHPNFEKIVAEKVVNYELRTLLRLNHPVQICALSSTFRSWAELSTRTPRTGFIATCADIRREFSVGQRKTHSIFVADRGSTRP